MLGGYKDRADLQNDASIQAAANFAADKLGEGKLQKILSAKSQVVAGTNYDLHLELASGKRYQVVVFEPLPCYGNQKELTSSKQL